MKHYFQNTIAGTLLAAQLALALAAATDRNHWIGSGSTVALTTALTSTAVASGHSHSPSNCPLYILTHSAYTSPVTTVGAPARMPGTLATSHVLPGVDDPQIPVGDGRAPPTLSS